ncbi:MAG: response regulator [Deltaproteobacteria bacterium]|nr:MAG: response regulator [Deltaproteobacteria bacterium]
MNRVLVVDPDPVARSSLAELLAGDGYTVRAAAGATEALRILGEFPADWVVTDLDLPDLSGKLFIRTVRAWARKPHVLAYTARDAGRHVDDAEVVSKPVSYEGLLAWLDATSAGRVRRRRDTGQVPTR